ncbi:MAG TPA: hypothetical protein VE133_08295 [Candidatus Sulfotelmatobacter sp.]|nr:hypothetical protein [Candidatus Sulfotelmatobacter sp.]
MPRPVAVNVVAAFLLLATLIAAIVGLSLLFPNPLMDRLWELNKPGAALFRSIGRVSGLFLLALGCGTFFAALGLRQGHPWAWWFAIVLFAVDGTGDVVSYFLVHDVLRTVTGVIVSSVFIYLLCRRDARAYFFRNALIPNHNA